MSRAEDLIGERVRLTRKARTALRWARVYYGNGSQSTGYPMRWMVREFGRCVGVVECPTDYNNVNPGHPDYDPDKVGPEVDVRWLPSCLRYAYDPADLELAP